MNSCAECVVRNHAICSALAPDEVDALNRTGRRHSIKRGQVLIWEGDESLLVANVIEGVLKLSTSTADGREQIVGVVYPSDFIGRPFGRNTQHTVTALTDARLCSFTRSAFDGFARQHPDLEHKLLERTLSELDRARSWMLLLGRKGAGEKVKSSASTAGSMMPAKLCDPLRDAAAEPQKSACSLPGLSVSPQTYQIMS